MPVENCHVYLQPQHLALLSPGNITAIPTSINRPLSIWGKDALWLKHSTRSKENKDKSKALLTLPFRTGKGEPAHSSFILEAIIALLFINIL